MSLNQTMNISLGSMKNNQYALTVVSQNIANMNVDGYCKQRVDFQTNEYTTRCENVISTIKGMNGASVSSLSNYIDNASFKNLLNSNSEAEYYATLADSLEALEGLADQLGDNGLNALLNDFYKAAANLEQFPTDMAIRQQYVMAAQNVCDKFNDISSKCNTIQDDKTQEIAFDIQMVNDLLENLAKANQEHLKNGQSTATKSSINAILTELSNYMDVTTTQNSNGTINVYLGDVAVVQGCEKTYDIEVDFNPDDINNVVNISLRSTQNPDYVLSGDMNLGFKSGKIKANIEFLNGTDGKFANINDFKASIDSAANAFATKLNEIQTYKSQPDGNVFAAALGIDGENNTVLIESTVEMFNSIDGKAINAGNIQVNSEIIDDPFLVAAARIDKANYEAGEDWSKSVGNSSNATLITAVQNEKICTYNNGKNKCTLNEFLTTSAADIGLDISTIEKKADTAKDIADADAYNYANMVGVNLDEELADMIKYQRSFEASARVFSAVNDMMISILGMV